MYKNYNQNISIPVIPVILVMTVNGLYFIEHAISDQLSDDTIKKLDEDQINKWIPLSTSASSKNNASRVVKHFGYKYGYNSYRIDEPAPLMPGHITVLRDIITEKCKELKLFDNLKDKKFVFNQCIVNNYNEGQGISTHTDLLKFGEIIGCFTLGGGAIMKFRNKALNQEHDVYTTNTSLYIMSGDARYNWTHEMPFGKSDTINGVKIDRTRRVSVTFRYVPT